MLKHVVSVFCFFVVTMAVQAGSHFAINIDHYSKIEFMRTEPIMPLGMAAIVIQALIMTFCLDKWLSNQTTISQSNSLKSGLVVSLAFGSFLASYITLASPAKYNVLNIPAWMIIEGSASFIQFTVFGLLLGYIHWVLRSKIQIETK